MSFYIQIFPGRNRETGEIDYCVFEQDFSIQDCVNNGWLDPTVPGGLWTRKEINRGFDPIDDDGDDCGYDPIEPFLIPDPQYGENLHLNLGMTKKSWSHSENGIRLY